jgi:hypothetical protein
MGGRFRCARDTLLHTSGASGFGSRFGGKCRLEAITLTAIAVERNRAEYDTFYEGVGPGWRWHGWGGIATTTIETVPVGILVVDIYEIGTHHLVWRGMAHDTLSDNPNTNAEKLEKAIDKMFRKFPATLS